MSSTSSDREHGESPVEKVHHNSWSINLETPEYADDPAQAIDHGIEAIEQTAPGNHVNLVTHETLGDPAEFLWPALEAFEGDITWEYVDQCGCGGHVTKVRVQ